MKISYFRRAIVYIALSLIMYFGFLVAKFVISLLGTYMKNGAIILPIVFILGSTILLIGLRLAKNIKYLWQEHVMTSIRDYVFAASSIFAISLGGVWVLMSVTNMTGWFFYIIFNYLEK